MDTEDADKPAYKNPLMWLGVAGVVVGYTQRAKILAYLQKKGA